MAQDFASIRFVTPEQFESILGTIDSNPGKFPAWFRIVLRTYWATGCRPAEIVGKTGRRRRSAEEGVADQSGIKTHHGLRARDIIGNHQAFIEGKNTNGGRARADALKPRNVLVADRTLYKDLQALALGARDPDANLFGLGPNEANPYKDGYWQLTEAVRRLRTFLPASMRGFETRWLRHSWAINALRRKVDLVSIQRQLGHSDLETTAIYLRYFPIDADKIIDAFENGHSAVETRDCPSCGFEWKVDTRTGAITFEDRAVLAGMTPTI